MISIIILLNIKNFKIIFDDAKLIKALKYTLIILLIGISSKNLIRISKNSKLDFNVWPNIYNSGNKFEKLENLKIKKDNETLFYKSKISECYYSKSPCTHFYNGNDFTLDEIDMKIVYGYKIYYFIR